MKAKRYLIAAIAILLLFSLVSCEGSSYAAVGLVRITQDNFCETSFYSLRGRLVMNPRYTGTGEGQIHYTASLEEGEINVYYERAGVTELLFNIKAGESVDARGGYIERGKQKIIIETVSPSRGKITVEFE